MGVYIPGIAVETLKKVPLEAVEALLAEGELHAEQVDTVCKDTVIVRTLIRHRRVSDVCVPQKGW